MATEQDLTDCLAAARTGRGAKLISENMLLELYHFAAQQNLILDGIEPFQIDGELELPHVDLTITPSEIREAYAHLCWKDRVASVKREVDRILNETRRMGGEFRFNAWVSAEAD